MSAKQKICKWSPSHFLDNSRFFETDIKFIESFFEIKNKNLQCLLCRNIADNVSFRKHFIDFNYLDWSSRYE